MLAGLAMRALAQNFFELFLGIVNVFLGCLDFLLGLKNAVRPVVFLLAQIHHLIFLIAHREHPIGIS